MRTKAEIYAYHRKWYRRNKPNGVLEKVHLDETEKQYIRDNSSVMRIAEIARYIGCDWTAVYYHIRKENLPRYRKQK